MPIRLEVNPASVMPAVPIQKTNSISLYPTSFLIHDLRKTGILTLFIIAFQLILLFVLKNHIISITWLSY